MSILTEKKIIDTLNAGIYSFEQMDNKFSRYDAFDKEKGIVLEVKCRKKHYDDTLIERSKFEWNKDYTEENNFDLFYCVSMPHEKGERIYVFDLLSMDKESYDFGWHTKKLPTQSTFSGSWKWIDKEVGYLNIKDALLTITKPISH